MGARDPEVIRIDHVTRHNAGLPFRDPGPVRDRHFIQPVHAMDDEAMLRAEMDQDLCQKFGEIAVKHA